MYFVKTIGLLRFIYVAQHFILQNYKNILIYANFFVPLQRI